MRYHIVSYNRKEVSVMQRVIGIDFGTSTTYMNVKRYNGNKPIEDCFSYMPVVFNYGESSGFVTSIVRENADGTFDFGEKASEQLEGAHIYTETKMLLESPDEAKRAEARRITQAFFKFLYETYAQQAANLGSADDTEETIISYPVKWQPETAQFMLDAARDAGFRNVRGMDEATAAVATVLCHNASSNLLYAGKPGYLMLVDMGAGTTDLVVCRYQADTDGGIKVELVTSWPQNAEEPTFGGREIDAVLEKYVEDYLTKALNPILAPQAHVLAATPGQAKMWKERNVSVSLAANKQVNTCAYIGTYKSMGMLTGDFPAFGRQEFEVMASGGLHDYVRLLEGCLADTAAKDPAFEGMGLDLVILTGGHSAWYFAREIVDGTMEGYLEHPALEMIRGQKNRVANLPNPQTTVSLGLVYSKMPFQLQKAEPKAAPVNTGAQEAPAAESMEWLADLGETLDMVIGNKTLEIVREAVRNDPDFCEHNKRADTAMVEATRAITAWSDDEEILYLNDGHTDNTIGLALTTKGIYRISGPSGKESVTFMNWKEFTDSQRGQVNCYRFQEREMRFSVYNAAQGMARLHSELRGEPWVGYEKNVRYRWDFRRMIPVVQSFIGADQDLNGRNRISRYASSREVWRKVGRHDDYEIFYVADFGKDYKSKAIICSNGLYVNYYQGSMIEYTFGPRNGHIPWGTFLNEDLRSSEFMRKITAQDFGTSSSLLMLQDILRRMAEPGEPAQAAAAPQQQPQSEKPETANAAPQPGMFVEAAEYDTSRCPKCGTPIPNSLSKCPLCGRPRLRELTIPYKLGMVSWYAGETKLGIAKATGSMTILNDRIEYKKNFGNTAAALTPYSAIYSLVKNNMDPKEIFWLRDVAAVKESTYGLNIPSIVVTMRSGQVYTFATALNTQVNQDAVQGAVALIRKLAGC